jgi:hypothetical protein
VPVLTAQGWVLLVFAACMSASRIVRDGERGAACEKHFIVGRRGDAGPTGVRRPNCHDIFQTELGQHCHQFAGLRFAACAPRHADAAQSVTLRADASLAAEHRGHHVVKGRVGSGEVDRVTIHNDPVGRAHIEQNEFSGHPRDRNAQHRVHVEYPPP